MLLVLVGTPPALLDLTAAGCAAGAAAGVLPPGGVADGEGTVAGITLLGILPAFRALETLVIKL